MTQKSINDLSHEIIGAAIEVHRELGLLINFNVRKLVDGVERVSNDAPSLSAPSAGSAFQPPPSG